MHLQSHVISWVPDAAVQRCSSHFQDQQTSLKRENHSSDLKSQAPFSAARWAVLETRTFYAPKYAITLPKKLQNSSKWAQMSSKCIKSYPKRSKIRDRYQKCLEYCRWGWNHSICGTKRALWFSLSLFKNPPQQSRAIQIWISISNLGFVWAIFE